MVCSKCGSMISEGLKFCPTCGAALNTIENNQINSNMNNNMYNQNNGYNYNNNNNLPEDNNNKKLLIVIIMVLILAIIAVLIFIKNKGKDSSSSNSNTSSNVEVTSNSNSDITSNPTSNIISNHQSNVTSNPTSNVTSNPTSNVKSNTNSNKNNNGNTVKHAGFLFRVPNTYTVSANTSQLILIGKDNVHVVAVNIIDGNYSNLKKNNKFVVNQMKSAGYTIGSIKTRKYNKVEFIIIPVAQGKQRMVMAYAKLTNKKVILFAFANTSYTLDYSQIPTFATMVATAKVAK